MDSFNKAFSIGNAALSWNAVMLALGILTAVVVSEIIVKKRKLYKDLALDACIVGIPAGLLGGRLFAAISGKIAFSEFFELSRVGLNLPGALLFVAVGITVYAKIKKLSISEMLDALAPGACFGLAVGRWSDFFLCEGLGPAAGAGVPKFFPLVTFTRAYFQDGKTVAYAVFFLDFLVCAALGVLALILLKKKSRGTAIRVAATTYLFAEFILEWLRDGSTRQIVFGEVRFNQIVLLAMLLVTIAVSLRFAKRQGEPAQKEAEPEPADAAEAPEEPEESDEPDGSEEPEKPEEPEEPEESAERTEA